MTSAQPGMLVLEAGMTKSLCGGVPSVIVQARTDAPTSRRASCSVSAGASRTASRLQSGAAAGAEVPTEADGGGVAALGSAPPHAARPAANPTARQRPAGTRRPAPAGLPLTAWPRRRRAPPGLSRGW